MARTTSHFSRWLVPRWSARPPLRYCPGISCRAARSRRRSEFRIRNSEFGMRERIPNSKFRIVLRVFRGRPGVIMRIVDGKVIVCCPGRNFVTLKLVTEDGVYGLGDATLNGRELAVASYLTDHLLPLLIGRDASRIEDTWQYLYKGAYWRRGPVTMSAIAAVDTALWDIKAKTAGMPLYELLGGRSRDGVMVYGHANGRDIAETVDEVARYID